MHKFLYSTSMLIAMFMASCLSLSAQNQPNDKERTLSVCFAFFPSAPEWFFRNSGGDYEELKSSTAGFNSTNKVPNSGKITFYREITDDDGKRVKQPATSVDLPESEGVVRLLYYLNEAGRPTSMVFSDSAETHPELSVRVLNLLDEPIGVVLGQLKEGSVERKIVGPKSEAVIKPVGGINEMFQFKYFRQGENGEPIPSSATNMIYRGPGQRYTVAVGYRPLYRYEAGSEEGVFGRSVSSMSMDKIIFFDETTPKVQEAR